MDQLLKNLKALERVDAPLVKRVVDHLQSKGVPPPLKDETGRSNLKVPNEKGKEEWLYTASLERETESLATRVQELHNPQLIILLGLGLGHHLYAYWRKPHRFNRFLLVVEPSLDVFCSFLVSGDHQEVLASPNVIWMVEIPDEQMASFLDVQTQKEHFGACAENFAILEWGYPSPAFHAFREEWTRFLANMLRLLNSTPIDSYYGFGNFLDNWNSLSRIPLLEEFKNIFQGKPGIVVSSGPSLDLSLEALKAVQDKVVIFAVGSALSLLQKHGIHSYLTCCLERDPDMASVFKKADTKDVRLCSSPVVHPEVYAAFGGPAIHLIRGQHFLPWIFPWAETHDSHMTGVSHVGIYVLHYLGCSTVYLLGQDLAFDPKTQESHAAGYIYDIKKKNIDDSGQTMVKVKSNAGQDMDTWINWYEIALDLNAMVKKLGVHCINVIPIDYGMNLDATIRKDPGEVFPAAFTEHIDVKSAIEKAEANFRENRQAHYEQSMAGQLETFKSYLNELFLECVKSEQSFYDFYNEAAANPEGFPAKIRPFLKEVEGHINKTMAHPLFEKVVFHMVSSRMIEVMRLIYSLVADDDALLESLKKKMAAYLLIYSEFVVRTRMILRRLRSLERDC